MSPCWKWLPVTRGALGLSNDSLLGRAGCGLVTWAVHSPHSASCPAAATVNPHDFCTGGVTCSGPCTSRAVPVLQVWTLCFSLASSPVSFGEVPLSKPLWYRLVQSPAGCDLFRVLQPLGTELGPKPWDSRALQSLGCVITLPPGGKVVCRCHWDFCLLTLPPRACHPPGLLRWSQQGTEALFP